MELSLLHAAVGNGRECNAISNKIKAEAGFAVRSCVHQQKL
jgi:hypothetical protein